MFTLIMGSNAGGFGLVSALWTDADTPHTSLIFLLVVHQYVFIHITHTLSLRTRTLSV